MPAARMISVVVADDQSSMRSLIRHGLSQLGFTDIREAPDGDAALKALTAKPAHLVLSDLNMPGLDGLALLKTVRETDTLKKTAFIMLTGSSDRESVQKAIQLGVNNYIVKPFTVANLRERIEAVLGKLQ
jgi:two-component system, chemotaxis family, chemotaxis protein CheY